MTRVSLLKPLVPIKVLRLFVSLRRFINVSHNTPLLFDLCCTSTTGNLCWLTLKKVLNAKVERFSCFVHFIQFVDSGKE